MRRATGEATRCAVCEWRSSDDDERGIVDQLLAHMETHSSCSHEVRLRDGLGAWCVTCKEIVSGWRPGHPLPGERISA